MGKVQTSPSRSEPDAVVAAATAGDQAAFAALAERYRRELRVHCYRMVGSFQDAEDLVQETLLRAWRSRQQFQGRSSFRAWLYRIATNACLDALAHSSRRVLPYQVAPAADPRAVSLFSPDPEVAWLQPYGVKQIAQDGLGLPSVLAILAGLAVGGAFVARQRALADPMIDMGLFKITAFNAALATNFLAIFVAVGYFLFVAQYLQLVVGLSPLRAGLWSLPSAFGFIIGSQLGPRVLGRVRPARVIGGGLGLAAVGLGLLTQVGVSGGLVPLVTGSVVISLGLAPVFGLTTELIVGAAPPEQAGAASGISETGAELGGALGIAAMGSIGVAIYRSRLAEQLPPGLPAGVAAAARDTLGSAVAVAAQLPTQLGGAVVQAARDAFVAGMQRSSVIGAAAAVGVAIIALVALRDRPAASTQAAADKELAAVPASGDGWPNNPEG